MRLCFSLLVWQTVPPRQKAAGLWVESSSRALVVAFIRGEGEDNFLFSPGWDAVFTPGGKLEQK